MTADGSISVNLSAARRHPGTVHVCSGICYKGCIGFWVVYGPINGKTYHKVLRKMLKASKALFGRRPFHFQQDNAPADQSNLIQNYLYNYSRNNQQMSYYKKKEFPPCSPNMSPIENLWPDLQQSVCPPTTVGALSADAANRRIAKYFRELKLSTIKKLISSVPDRIYACIAANHGPTKY